MTTMCETEGALTQHRDKLLAMLVERAAELMTPQSAAIFRPQAKKIIVELKKADRAIASIHEPPGPFQSCPRHIDAIVKCLADAGRPMREEEIIDTLIDAGYKANDPGTSWKTSKSIMIHLRGTGKGKHVIKKIGELIGLPEWDDSLFAA